jgi:hypothetical protein
MRVKVRACTLRGHGHVDSRDRGDDTTTGKKRAAEQETKGGQQGCARGEGGGGTYKKQDSQPGSMAGITQRVRSGAAAFLDMVASAPGSTHDLDSKVGRHKRVGRQGAHLRSTRLEDEGGGEERLDAGRGCRWRR